MSIFKKKKTVQAKELLANIKDMYPEVIKESKIKPTKCEFCKTIYQAKQKHIRHVRDIGNIHEKYKYTLCVKCPICSNYNPIEFEDDTKNDEIMPPCKLGDLLYMPWEWNGQKGVACLKVTTLTNILGFGWSCGTDFNTDDDEYAEEYNCGRFKVEDFGKTVFLTREEAEQALKGARK